MASYIFSGELEMLSEIVEKFILFFKSKLDIKLVTNFVFSLKFLEKEIKLSFKEKRPTVRIRLKTSGANFLYNPKSKTNKLS